MLYGTDPEVFSLVNGEIISPALLMSSGIISPVEMDEKHPVFLKIPGIGKWHMDGAAWELCTEKPVETAKEMYKLINNALGELQEFFSKLDYLDDKITLKKTPVAKIDPQKYVPFLSDPLMKWGFIFGCDEDEDAIEENYICQTLDVKTWPWRYGGGHLHFSGHSFLYEHYRRAVQIFAITVGNYCISESQYPDEEKQRADVYGKAGRYRLQNYSDGTKGLEIRSPSNSWISMPEEKMEKLFDWAEKALGFLTDPVKGEDLIAQYLNSTVTAIRNCEQGLSEDILLSIGD